ncbi:MAG: MotA/TolQ/ExbB proton channel family protein [Phycisphaerales bacterium]|uniref:MotA/TolQ/ExbB proton channel family protein n=1 Tax=Spectribacter acetivorans TaxID=3075603 RepID=A0ABU3B9D5_9GAMM|nr:MotA/TolQ/ExbB proton channel family protein [Salinisphaera sp. P385]MDT0619087.1 MotA/TolQ/ExbB proton channel family protein [Salinisphaera sp. P385]
MEAYNTIVSFFQNGGPFMFPIVFILGLGLAIALERWWHLRRTEIRNRKEWDRLSPILASGDYDRAQSATADSKAEIGTILNYGLSRLRTSHRREDVEMAMEESLMETVPNLERRTHYLATFANIATLLGLLGTIIGLIQAFTAVANADPAEKADLLSASISVAMNTTAFGLMVAIPLLLIHALLSTKTTHVVDSLEMASVKFLNTVPAQRQQDGQTV